MTVFVHIPRTAGTSFSNVTGIPGPHKPILYYVQKERKRLDKEVTVSIIRHPLDQIESWYWWDEYKYHKPFEEWVDLGFPIRWQTRFRCDGMPEGYPEPIDQAGWIEIDGERMVEHILRFETLERDITWFCESVLNIEPPKLHKYNQGSRRKQQTGTVWTPETIEKVKPIVGDFAEKYGYELWMEAIG